ncbi:MAG: hypothetical protein ACOYL6_10355 [Bacteriovoracaceae bacterium]
MKKLILGTLLLTTLAGMPLAQAQMVGKPQIPSQGYTQPYVSYIDAEMMDQFVDLANGMRSYVTPLEFAQTYSPLRSKALKCKAYINTYGLASASTNKALKSLSDYVMNNEEALERLWEIDAFYETANLLFTTALQLEKDLR